MVQRCTSRRSRTQAGPLRFPNVPVAQHAIPPAGLRWPSPRTPAVRHTRTRRQAPPHPDAYHKKKRLLCPYADCGKYLTRNRAFSYHIKIHTGEKPFLCEWPDCTAAFRGKPEHRRHMKKHTADMPFPCPYETCGKRFLRKTAMQAHVLVHTRARPFACPVENCAQRFRQRVHRNRHQLVFHDKKRPFVCHLEGCGRSFARKDNMLKHLITRPHNRERPAEMPFPGSHCLATGAAPIRIDARHPGMRPLPPVTAAAVRTHQTDAPALPNSALPRPRAAPAALSALNHGALSDLTPPSCPPTATQWIDQQNISEEDLMRIPLQSLFRAVSDQ